MVPPSRPNVTRLADDAVMLRWNVPKNDGLPIQFFKVQYRMLGDNARKIPREDWQTTNENIPYGRQQQRERERDRDRDRDHQRDHHEPALKSFTSSVTGLRPDRNYRFRIIAVYSNNDNKEGNTSAKFFLRRGAAKSNLPVPELREIESYSESAVVLHWTLASTSAAQLHNIDGYYAYYRPASSASDYLKATVDGGHARRFKIDQLEPGTAYEFKLQSFNAHAASEFSEIKQGRTTKSASQTPPAVAPAPNGKSSEQHENSIYPVIAGAAGGGLLLLIAIAVACLCLRRRNNSQPEDENKPQLDHIQADFVTSAVLGVAPHHNHNHGHGHKPGDLRRLNGVIPRMNITPNPLAQDPAADKNRNVMELRFLPPANGIPAGAAPEQAARHVEPAAGADTYADADADVDAETEANADADADADADNAVSDKAQTCASSSCETLEACDGLSQSQSQSQSPSMAVATEAPSKPLPPLPKKTAAAKAQQQQQQQQQNGNAMVVAAAAALHQPGLHHAQPYHAPGTPTFSHKRHEYQQLQAPPPVPPHATYYQQQQQQQQQQLGAGGASPMLDQQRRTLERSVRSLQQQQQHPSYGLDDGQATPTRIPSLRRQRRASGSQPHNSHTNLNNHHNNNNNNNNNNISSNNNNNNNSNNNNNNNVPHHLLHHHATHHHPHNVGIPHVPGSPRVQRSPMPARALIKRTRLGSHTDNISSGSLNSIEV
ncbi:general transcriptional corepressor CYC8 isoform X1 [Drosophila navojoa]|uniref:general transcriptional corepressor CYC8 isoform X1 n=1 Tax=Drosophila navojoa TaxID=7232 RepID=UPI0011BF1A30|nr:general transcriptional corepressor CYC8 isoform X1 [Drosophila navojoa]